MRFFIRLENGQPIDHPIIEENMIQAFPEVDLDNLPENFAEFVRVDVPAIGTYEIYEGSSYQWVDGVVKDVHTIRPMTEKEKIANQNIIEDLLTEQRYPSWVFDEQTGVYKPPVEHPRDGKHYVWNEEELNWIEVVINK